MPVLDFEAEVAVELDRPLNVCNVSVGGQSVDLHAEERCTRGAAQATFSNAGAGDVRLVAVQRVPRQAASFALEYEACVLERTPGCDILGEDLSRDYPLDLGLGHQPA